LANFLLAILLFWALFMTGVPILKPVLDAPPERHTGRAGRYPGRRAGDRVQWRESREFSGSALAFPEIWPQQDQLSIETVDARGYLAQRSLLVLERDETFEQAPLKALGLLRYMPPLPPVLAQLTPGGPAASAGLQSGDRILAINNQPVGEWNDVVTRVRQAPNLGLRFSVERQGSRHELVVTPEAVGANGETGRIGAAPEIDPALFAPYQDEARYGPIESYPAHSAEPGICPSSVCRCWAAC
jgi:regulator of sigma E protease